ncbi:MAG: GntR family transcriptional regulator, vanillate catabolism transcriptional regulator [Sphingomonadales bacterium]|nr:GntR family transcriptional regulator, vanillate catabolism transcriptional regulator [Sphingomonadales bacterium]
MDSPVAQRIREMIVDGTLAAGTRVAEATIAERLGVSRTPVRNALPALATEGLLEPAGKRGYAVRGFSVEDSFRATEIRCVLEGYAARELAARPDRAAIVAELHQCLKDGDAIFAKGYVVKEDESEYARMNRRFHDIIVEGARDALLGELIHRVYSVPFVAPGVVAFNRVPLAEIYPILVSGHHQHHAIVDAIEGGQPDVAESLMRGHSSPARRSLGLERPGGEMSVAV